MAEAIAKERPVRIACTRYNSGARNMKENFSGSVTPVKKEATAAAIIRAPTALRRLVFARK